MELEFDIRGNLFPYQKVRLSISEFKERFVDSFDAKTNRKSVFLSYETYTYDFRRAITPKLTQWINGSFISNKVNPRDIDLVNLVEYSNFQENGLLNYETFINENSYKKYGIDAYLLVLYPKGHKLYSWSQSDLLYWNDWFSRTRKDRLGKRHPKGYVEIVWD